MGSIRHLIKWIGLLLSIVCLVCFCYGMHKSYQSMLPQKVFIRFADLEPLPRGLSSIVKLLDDRLPAGSTASTSIVAYRYAGHTLFDVVSGNDSITIPAHITDSLPPVYVTPPSAETAWSDSLLKGTQPLDRYVLDYRRIIARYDGQVNRIEWNSFDTIPLYIISLEGHDEPIYINASTPLVKPFYLNEEVVSNAVKSFCQADSVSTELLTDYDNFYADYQKIKPLPVWKVAIGDHRLYVNPRTGAYLSYNTSSWLDYLQHNAFNTLRYKLFAKHPELWQPVKWIVLILGVLSSLTCVLVLTRKILNNKTN